MARKTFRDGTPIPEGVCPCGCADVDISEHVLNRDQDKPVLRVEGLDKLIEIAKRPVNVSERMQPAKELLDRAFGDER